jgi:hypothetical protein
LSVCIKAILNHQVKSNCSFLILLWIDKEQNQIWQLIFVSFLSVHSLYFISEMPQTQKVMAVLYSFNIPTMYEVFVFLFKNAQILSEYLTLYVIG